MKFALRIPQYLFTWIKKHKILAIIGVVIIGILIFVFRPKPPPPPETITIKRSDLVQSLSVSGQVVAKKIANLSPLSSGPLMYLGAQKGDSVKAGQTIAVIDQRIIQKNLEATLISYNKQRVAFEQTVADHNGISKANDALSDNMKRILQNNQFDLDKAVNSVELQDLAKQQSVLTSPIAGILTRTDAVTPGTTVGPTTVFTVVDPTSLVFHMDVDEADVGKVALGQKVKVVLDAFPNTTITFPVAAIDFVSHPTANGGNAFTVEVTLPASGNQYRVGMNGNADIVTGQRFRVLTVPLSSIFENNKVYIKTKTGYEKRTIVTGLQTDTDTEVVRGLAEGDIVVLQPADVPTK